MRSGWFEIWDEQREHENDGGMNPDDYYRVIHGTKLHVVAVEERDEFGEWMAEESGWQDYGNIVSFRKRGVFHKDELKKILEDIEEQEKKEGSA